MKRLLTSIALAVLLFFCATAATAQSSGFDLLQTSSGTSVDLTSLGLGMVPLHGVPILSSLGNTDTIMNRTGSGPGVVPLDVYALFTKSNNPVTFQHTSCDVYVTINNSGGAISTSVLPQPDGLAGSTGTITIRSDGTFDSNFTVNADVIFVKAGTSVTNSANWVGHQPASGHQVFSNSSSWSSSPPPGYPSSPSYPSGGFYPKPIHVSGPHPVVPASCPPGGASPVQSAKPIPRAAIATCISAQ